MTLQMHYQEKYEQGLERGLEQGLERGLAKGRIDAVRKMIRKNYSTEDILDLGYSEEEYREAEASMLIKA